MGLIENIRQRFAGQEKIQDYEKVDIPNIYGVGAHEEQLGLSNAYLTDRSQMLRYFESWIYACIDVRGKGVQSAVHMVQYKKGMRYENVSDRHPLVKLLNDPNAFMTRQELLYTTVAHLDLTGNAFWYTPVNGLGVPAEIWPLPPDKVKIIPDRNRYISHFLVETDPANPIRLELDEIVHMKYPHPNDSYYGMSPLKAAAYAADINRYQHRYQRWFFENYAVPEFLLKTEQKLGNDVVKRLRKDWKKLYGAGPKREVLAILEQGLDVAKLGVSPKDLDWLATNKATMAEICGIYQVPPHKIGQQDVPNRAVAEASEYAFAKTVVEPILDMIDARITQDLAWEFDDKIVVRHQPTIPEDIERAARVRDLNVRAGITTRNEERERLALPAVEGGDEILVPLNYAPLSQVISGEARRTAPAPEPEEEDETGSETEQDEAENETTTTEEDGKDE